MALYKVTEQVDVTKFYDKDKCQLNELIQYQCEANRTNIECTPFVRLFLKCQGVPTVEVTPNYNEDGEVIDSNTDDIRGDKNNNNNSTGSSDNSIGGNNS